MNAPDQRPSSLRLCAAPVQASAPLVGELLPPNTIAEIPVAMVIASPYQPRLVFNEARLNELKESIGIQGLIKPIIVRSTEAGYENAIGYARILRLGQERSQASLAASLGISKSTVSRCLLLVELPENIQAILKEKPGLITSNYAKKFIDYTKQDPFLVERVIRSAMLGRDEAKRLGQVATLQLIGQRFSACTKVTPKDLPKQLTGFGTMKIKGQKLEIKCKVGIDPIRLQEQFEKFLSQIDLSILRADLSAKEQW